MRQAGNGRAGRSFACKGGHVMKDNLKAAAQWPNRETRKGNSMNTTNIGRVNIRLAFSTKNAAAMLDIGVTKFRQVMKEHGIEPVRVLGDPRWRLSDLKRVLRQDARQ